jgi:16S rRNA (cytosine1402-N4)-methyltransferase
MMALKPAPRAAKGGHVPVLLAEVMQALAPADGEIHIDATFGGGGYARAILARAEVTLLAIDRDLDAMVRAEALAAETRRLIPVLGRFGDMDEHAEAHGITGVDGVVMDIGVSSFQLDEAHRGFSFQADGPLDMRMGASGPSAADAVNLLPEADLANVIYRLGEERQSRRIAAAIVARRKEASFETTRDLAAVIETACGGRRGERMHPATQSFQALRMYVNDELGELGRALVAAEKILKPGGRLVIVAFHSLEDRLVKTWLKERAGKTGGASRHIPLGKPGPAPAFNLLTAKAIVPGEKELESNPRARSAKLRAAVRTLAPARPDPVEDLMRLPPLDRLEKLS